MKVLMVDKYHFIKGGAEKYLFELTDILTKNGHQVIPFSMKHERNFDSAFEEHFVENIEFNLNTTKEKILNSPRIISRIIYSRHAQKKIEALINKTKPDIAHLHMIDHQISPSILSTLHKYNIPILQTVHQYKIACPNYRFYIEHKNEICEKCISGKFYHPIIEKCHKNSYLASSILSIEAYVHKILNVYKNIGLFHVPSQFLGNKLIESGVDPKKVRHQFLTINLSDYAYHPAHDDYLLYFGRLSCEKGLHTLLEAMKKIADKTMNLYIVGEGPLRPELEAQALSFGLTNVKFLGYKGGDELREIISKSKFVVIPSEWYENSPVVIYEAFALGKPVIGSRLGGIPEFIEDNVNGMLFDAHHVEQLSQKIESLYKSPELIKRFGENARKRAEEEFSWDNHYNKMMALYEELLNN